MYESISLSTTYIRRTSRTWSFNSADRGYIVDSLEYASVTHEFHSLTFCCRRTLWYVARYLSCVIVKAAHVGLFLGRRHQVTMNLSWFLLAVVRTTPWIGCECCSRTMICGPLLRTSTSLLETNFHGEACQVTNLLVVRIIWWLSCSLLEWHFCWVSNVNHYGRIS